MNLFKPMSPLLSDHLPIGEEWLYQLKWDGIRIVAEVQSKKVTLYSKNMQIRNDSFPELVQYLQQLEADCILDGEVVVIHPEKQRPDFHLILKRLRSKKSSTIEIATRYLPVTYVLFDILSLDGQDQCSKPFYERKENLQQLFPVKSNLVIVTDTFTEGDALWQWVNTQQWEGVVSKKAHSMYRFGKQHNDWFKTKVERKFDVAILGYTINGGRLASLIMELNGSFCGKVSAGLNQHLKKQLAELSIISNLATPPIALPPDVRRNTIRWFAEPLSALVTSLEMTDYGVLRHPKIVELRGIK